MSRRRNQEDMTIAEFKARMKDPDFGVPDPIDEDDSTDFMTIGEFKDYLTNPGDFE